MNRDTTLLTNNSSSTLEYQDITTYDLASNVTSTQEIYPGSTVPTRTVTNNYDAIYRLSKETSAIASGGTTVTSYTYDDSNNRTSKTVKSGSGNQVTDYSLNNLNQITEKRIPVPTLMVTTLKTDSSPSFKVQALLLRTVLIVINMIIAPVAYQEMNPPQAEPKQKLFLVEAPVFKNTITVPQSPQSNTSGVQTMEAAWEAFFTL